jgi:hypothetical protein
MDGLFNGDHVGTDSECVITWCDIELLRDIGPFKKGDFLQHASFSEITHKLTLVMEDEAGEEMKSYSCDVKVGYDYSDDRLEFAYFGKDIYEID